MELEVGELLAAAVAPVVAFFGAAGSELFVAIAVEPDFFGEDDEVAATEVEEDEAGATSAVPELAPAEAAEMLKASLAPN